MQRAGDAVEEVDYNNKAVRGRVEALRGPPGSVVSPGRRHGRTARTSMMA